MWAALYWIARYGNRARNDLVAMYVFGGDERRAAKAIGALKSNEMATSY